LESGGPVRGRRVQKEIETEKPRRGRMLEIQGKGGVGGEESSENSGGIVWGGEPPHRKKLAPGGKIKKRRQQDIKDDIGARTMGAFHVWMRHKVTREKMSARIVGAPSTWEGKMGWGGGRGSMFSCG